MRRLTAEGVAPAEAAALGARTRRRATADRADAARARAPPRRRRPRHPGRPRRPGRPRPGPRRHAPGRRRRCATSSSAPSPSTAWSPPGTRAAAGARRHRRAARGHRAADRGRAPVLPLRLRGARRGAAARRRADPPRILLACADEEQHSLPLEALAAALAEAGVPAGCSAPGCRPALGDAGRPHRSGRGRALVADRPPPATRPARPRAAGPHRPLLVAAAGPGWPADLPAGVALLTGLTGCTANRPRRRVATLPLVTLRPDGIPVWSGAGRSRMLSKPPAGPDGSNTAKHCDCAMMAGPPSSSSGPGRRPFKAVARVRIPLGARYGASPSRARSCGAVGVLAALSRRRSRVQVPSGPQR